MYRILLTILIAGQLVNAQNITITPNGIAPLPSLEYSKTSYETIQLLSGVSKGDIAYDTTFNCLRIYNGAKWICSYTPPNEPSINMAVVANAGNNTSYTSNAGNTIILDSLDNSYVTGSFSGITHFNNTQVGSNGGHDIFIAKYDLNGNLIWVKSYGGIGGDGGSNVKMDKIGFIYISGTYTGTVNFNGVSLTSQGNSDVFLLKLNQMGDFQWVKSIGGSLFDNPAQIAIDVYNDIYITGNFRGTATFETISKTSNNNSSDIFIAKYNSSGIIQWVQTSGNSNEEIVNDMVLDGSGNLIISGYYSQSSSFGSHTITSIGNTDIFVAKYDPIGITWEWAKSFGGSLEDVASSIAKDSDNNFYLTGKFVGLASFDSFDVSSNGDYDLFVSKIDNDGAVLWVKALGGKSSEIAHSIKLDKENNILVCGQFFGSETANFDGIIRRNLGGYSHLYVLKLTNNGSLIWIQSSIGNNSEYALSLDISPTTNNIILTCGFLGTAKFGNNTLSSSGPGDILLLRVSED
jgi:hypothetical protein